MGGYRTIELTHRDEITEIRFHTDGGVLRWSPTSYEDAYHAFTAVGRRARHQGRADHGHRGRLVHRARHGRFPGGGT